MLLRNHRLPLILSSILLITVSIFSIATIAKAETIQNDTILSKLPKPYSGSYLQEFLSASPNHSADILYINGKDAPVLIPNIHAMPLHPETKNKLQVEGKLKEVVSQLNSLKQLRALEGIAIDQPTRKLQSTNAGEITISAVTGVQKAIVLFVDFSDNTAKTNALSFYNLLFGSGSSMRDFYQSVSYNKVYIEGTVSGFYRAPTTYVYYVNNDNGFGSYPRNAQKLVEDAIDLANPYVDFSQYDADGNGWVDCLFVVHSGPGAEWTGSLTDIWSHQWGISTKTVDGVHISEYSMEPEYWSSPGDMTIGVYCHELGHVFGLPDLYDTDYTSEGLGNWSLMAGGSWNGTNGNQPSHPDAWCKLDLGWVQPIIPTVNIMSASIPACETTQTIYKLWTNGTAASQYFLVENRQRTGYDSRIPSSGLAIYHVDDSQWSNDNEWYPGHTSSGHYHVALEQADGLWQLEKGTSGGNSGDPWPGSSTKRVFDATSIPDSKSYSGASTKVAVKQISNSGTLMTADIYVTDPVPVELSRFEAVVTNNPPQKHKISNAD